MAAFRDQVAVITGAGREVGRAHGLRLACDGVAVVLVDIARNTGRPIEYSLADEEGSSTTACGRPSTPWHQARYVTGSAIAVEAGHLPIPGCVG